MKGDIYHYLKTIKKAKVIYLLLLVICCFPFISAAGALSIGLLYSLVWGVPWKSAVDKWSIYLIKAAVIGLGFGINISVLLQAGRESIGITAAFVFGALIAGILLGLILKIDRVTALLIAVGTAICGGSAIAAVGTAIKADTGQLSISTAAIFILNALALFAFPAIGHWLGLSQEQFGHWAAIAIHDTSSVIGAALKYGDEALQVASIGKMLRILWIIPVLLVAVIGSSGKRRAFRFPLFIIGFILTSCLASFLPSLQGLFDYLYIIAKQLMVVGLFLIGSSLSVRSIKQVGVKVMFQAIALWLLVSTISLLFIR